jgi:uncharacterized membrane protein YhdT
MRPDPREEDALNQLTELLDGIEERVESGHRIAVLDERNRITLLFGHAIFAILVAPGFAMITKTSMSSPSFVLVRNVPGAPYSFAVWIGLAGLGLAIATMHRHRRGEFYALAALFIWYVAFSVSLIGAIAVWSAPAIHAGGLSGFSGHLDWKRAPSLYAPIVYAHLAYAMAGHMNTLLKRGLHRGGGP